MNKKLIIFFVGIKSLTLLGLILLTISPLYSHEPLFGLGPHTIYQYGYALESEFEKGEHGWSNYLEFLYGVTPDFAVTLAAPYLFAEKDRSAGFGDVTLRSKFRFFRADAPGASNQAALHAGVKFPTGSQEAHRGSGTTDYFFGASFGHESRRHYFFAGVRYQVNGSTDELSRGNDFEYDVAYGIRPCKLEYLHPDLVFLLEMNGEVIGRNSSGRNPDRDSGGSVISLAPGLLLSYRNVMLKAGVKIPVIKNLNGVQEDPGSEVVLGLEFHMPPLR